MEAIRFVVGTLLQVLLVIVFLLRVLLPLARADSRNQLSQAVIRMTNPLVMPLRKVLPPIGKVDTASVVALIIVQAAAVALLWLLGGYPGVFTPGQFAFVVFLTLITTVLNFYIFAMVLYAILSWIAPGTYSPAAALLDTLCEPLLRPVRRLIPPLGGIDFSALFVIVGLQAINIALGSVL
ncbi:YggT family protein [Steroidobacter sp.]|uniref:YggT family protein n=1 Tax=Steroidobacter sp. TaxID=1978227 RepID=UPI001A51422D|nr:YggT family protein [Steroidobacter sp.]MBL8270786.1 YggT family protein [Steroidobacter sp.]